ncbi:hypothetical protein GON22_06345 [Paenibacillus sp. MMS18-CY102]|nr:hypothetical protein [Paenibacillus sp. MMS18-CY102]
MVKACEQWAAVEGFAKLSVRTNQARSGAVHFYKGIH